jgi:hypothetical protein
MFSEQSIRGYRYQNDLERILFVDNLQLNSLVVFIYIGHRHETPAVVHPSYH